MAYRKLILLIIWLITKGKYSPRKAVKKVAREHGISFQLLWSIFKKHQQK